jgi:hypothetical protein
MTLGLQTGIRLRARLPEWGLMKLRRRLDRASIFDPARSIFLRDLGVRDAGEVTLPNLPNGLRIPTLKTDPYGQRRSRPLLQW